MLARVRTWFLETSDLTEQRGDELKAREAILDFLKKKLGETRMTGFIVDDLIYVHRDGPIWRYWFQDENANACEIIYYKGYIYERAILK